MVLITLEAPASKTQSTEWNSTTVFKRSDKQLYTSETVTIPVFFTFYVRREIFPSISSMTVEQVAKDIQLVASI